MTKTQISVRVSPDTLAAIDAAAQVAGTSRGHIIDRWLAAQAQAGTGDTQVEAGKLAAGAREYVRIAAKSEINRDASILSAIMLITDAIDVLAGTAPDTSPAGGQ